MSERDLARAIIKQALRDAFSKKDTQIRQESRNFLIGSSKAWLTSLEDICLLAEMNPYRIMKTAQNWQKNGWPNPKYLKNLLKF